MGEPNDRVVSPRKKATKQGSSSVKKNETTRWGGSGGEPGFSTRSEPQQPASPVPGETPSDEGSAVPPLIIIDAGHGGKDPGAIGIFGKGKKKTEIREKDVTLQISKHLAAALKKKMGARVVFTRPKDTFITLGERDRIANANACDLFLSVHANASTSPKSEGLEIYYLNKATDQASRRLAQRENEGAPQEEREMEAIVSDLIQTASTEESAELARDAVAALQKVKKKHRIEDIQVKTALFYVLVGAKCPSLLIETGFITHPVEGKRLKQSVFQKDLANAIAEAVLRYWKKSENSGSDL